MEQEEINKKFREIFNRSFEEGRDRLRLLMRRTVAYQKFWPEGDLSMTPNDFALVSFFACLGAGQVEEFINRVPPEKKLNVLDVEYEEVLNKIENHGKEGK